MSSKSLFSVALCLPDIFRESEPAMNLSAALTPTDKCYCERQKDQVNSHTKCELIKGTYMLLLAFCDMKSIQGTIHSTFYQPGTLLTNNKVKQGSDEVTHSSVKINMPTVTFLASDEVTHSSVKISVSTFKNKEVMEQHIPKISYLV